MHNIRSYKELQEEKNRLQGVLVVQKELIGQDIQALKEKYKPTLRLLSVASGLLNKDSSNPLVALLVNFVGEVFLKNTVLSRSSKITRFVVPFLMKKASTFFLSPQGNSILHKLTSGLKRKSNGLQYPEPLNETA